MVPATRTAWPSVNSLRIRCRSTASVDDRLTCRQPAGWSTSRSGLVAIYFDLIADTSRRCASTPTWCRYCATRQLLEIQPGHPTSLSWTSCWCRSHRACGCSDPRWKNGVGRSKESFVVRQVRIDRPPGEVPSERSAGLGRNRLQSITALPAVRSAGGQTQTRFRIGAGLMGGDGGVNSGCRGFAEAQFAECGEYVVLD